MNTTYEPSAITFTWAAASSPFCGEVMYYLAILSSDEYYNTMNVSMTTATFSNLTSNTNYTITVSAVNEGGAGMSTTIMNISTSPPDDNQSMYLCMYVCMYVCMNVCLFVYMYVMHVCMYVRMHVYMYVCMYVCMYGTAQPQGNKGLRVTRESLANCSRVARELHVSRLLVARESLAVNYPFTDVII